MKPYQEMNWSKTRMWLTLANSAGFLVRKILDDSATKELSKLSDTIILQALRDFRKERKVIDIEDPFPYAVLGALALKRSKAIQRAIVKPLLNFRLYKDYSALLLTRASQDTFVEIRSLQPEYNYPFRSISASNNTSKG